ncbi:NADP-dependent malic enzyme [Candidatus Pelagibacter sp.]|nr:NADP-dependent malic enzyme [Candidatus Pelagibacter sp.]
MKKTKIDHYTDKEALEFHSLSKPGKIEINSSKPMTTKRDLALAYSPGVAVPVQAIADNPETAYDYTSKGNLVAVISNGSAILGMGNLGALASKPVMEGKAVLFKRFADIDSIDLEIDSQDSDEIKNSGVPSENVIMLDRKGVVYRGRTEGMDQWKSAHAVETKKRTLEEAINGADVFLGLSAKGALKKELVKTMAKNPIIFACANPDPEITPEEIMEVRDDAIIATGRSDYPNQVNNLIGFPYIFRGALDVRATTINEEMKVAAANAIAKLAREDVPDEVVAAMGGDRPKYGKDYIIPSTFDPRLISVIPAAVAKAAMDSGVAKKPIKDFEAYKDQLKQRLDPSVTIMQGINSHIKKNQKRIVFADGEDENTLKAAIAFKNSKLGTPILIGKKTKIIERIKEIGYNENFDIEIVNSEDTKKREKYVNFLFEKMQREKGLLERDCDRLVRNDRVVWASCMVACGDADGAVTGNTRRFGASFDKVTQVIDARPGEIMFGLNMVVAKGKTIFVGDTSVNEYPSSEELAEIAISSARVVKMFGFVPKVAFVSHSTFGQPLTSRTKHIKKAVEILKDKNVDFDFDGDMQPDVALNEEYKELYPFSSIVGNANILIMPGQHSAAISYKMMKSLGDTRVIGPLLIGLGQPIEIAPLRSSTSEIINLASVAAYSADVIDYKKN